jgi:hypothetical protein
LTLSVKGKERMMNLRSIVYSLWAANRNVGARKSSGTCLLIVGLVALVLTMGMLGAALSIVATGAAEQAPPQVAPARSLALTSQPIGEAFARSVALIDQSPVGYVATSGPTIGQSVFPGDAVARSLALTSQAASDYEDGR